MIARSRRFAFTAWWRTVDKLMLAALLVVMLAGIVLSLAASPPVAARLGLDPFYFVNRHVLYLVPAVAVMLGTSMLTPRQIRRIALVVFAVSFVMVIATLFFGAEIKGARRWLIILGINIQPSEFLKPAFVILTAWLFAESASKPDVPANALAIVLLLTTIAALVAQPDFGQTTLVALVWGALFFMAGMRFVWVIGLTGVAVGGLVGATMMIPHVAARIKRFLDPASGDTFQIIVLRALTNAMRNSDPFARFATAGLAILFGTQSAINMAVNLALIPAKGMTLPFISYGGSSIISLAYGTGMMLALMRERPNVEPIGVARGLVVAGSPA